jgi:mitochondrial fission protein ELM1
VGAAATPLAVWRVTDGRRGHDSQSLGLIDALARRRSLDVTELPAPSGAAGALSAWRRRRAQAAPALVVGAGHATHAALLVAARARPTRSVVLMRPSLPRRLFDLCIIPAHDDVPEGGNVMLSLGALNRVVPATERDPDLGLILVGGPSRHHGWDSDALARQVGAIAAGGEGRWLAAGSPRTPPDALARLRTLGAVQTVAVEDCGPGWLAAQLARATRVWVTEDSVSMAYEAASSGAATGVLPVPVRRPGRVQAAVARLLRGGYALSFDDWRAGAPLSPPPEPLQEAERCARALMDRWPDLA